MKKVFSLMFVALIGLFALTGCGGSDDAATDDADTAATTTIKVGASVTPHAEILEVAKPLLEAEGYTLEIVEFNDYVQPNLNVDNGELDANYFQHKPYLDDFNAENGTELVSVGAIHYEPFGIYPGKTATIDALPDGATIAVPNDGTNEARALMLLEQEGLITLSEDAGFTATALDIAENPKDLKIQEIEAAQLARSLPDVDMAVINGNYAIEADLSVKNDAVAIEDAEGEAAQTYANIVAVAAGRENDEAIQALVKALTSEEVRTFINDTYDGAVIPIF
ncbi:MAG: MetQ/NlpA family ABC transporter substrate-binding protein [Bacillota bacterium]|nr:MetQ/NlpA family ABC transporter substrate-binding protein [Bacillota bacterium]